MSEHMSLATTITDLVAGRDGVGFASSWMVFASQAAITGQGLSIAENAPFLSSYTTIDKDRGLNVNVSAPDLIGVDVAAGGGNGTTAVVTIGNKQYGVKVGENDAVKIEAGPISIPVSCCKL